MATIIETISTRIKNAKILVKFRRKGKSDIQETKQIAPFGLDSNPTENMVGLYLETENRGEPVVIGYIQPEALAGIGESRLFSTDANGNLKMWLHLKNDGTAEFFGDDDNLLRFSNTKLVIDEIQSDLAALKSAFNSWVVVPSDGGAALKTAAATWSGSALTENIDASKIDEIKTKK